MKKTSIVRNISLSVIAGLFFSLALTACSEPPQPSLRIASSPWPGYEPLYLARDLGYLDEKKVSLFELPSSDITMESFRNYSTDLATLTLDETLELIHDGIPLKILQVMDISHGGDAVMAPSHIKTLADLKGQRITIVNIPLGLYMLNRLLNKAGLKRSDVTVFPMSESKQVAAYEQGKVDVVITFDPIKTRLAKKGMHVLFDSSDIPNEIFDLLLVHDDVYQSRRDEVCNIVRQWHKSLDYIQQNNDDAAKRISKRLDINITDYAPMMAGLILPSATENAQLLSGTTPGIIKPAKNLSKIMLEEKQLSHMIDIRPALDASFSDCYAK